MASADVQVAHAVPVAYSVGGGGPPPKHDITVIHAEAVAVAVPVADGGVFAGGGPPPVYGAAYRPGMVSKIELGLRWDMVRGSKPPVDLDAQCVLFDYTGHRHETPCFYNNQSAAGGAVMLSADNTTGEGEGGGPPPPPPPHTHRRCRARASAADCRHAPHTLLEHRR